MLLTGSFSCLLLWNYFIFFGLLLILTSVASLRLEWKSRCGWVSEGQGCISLPVEGSHRRILGRSPVRCLGWEDAAVSSLLCYTFRSQALCDPRWPGSGRGERGSCGSPDHLLILWQPGGFEKISHRLVAVILRQSLTMWLWLAWPGALGGKRGVLEFTEIHFLLPPSRWD